MKRLFLITVCILVLIVLVGGVMVAQFNLSALPEPGRRETFLAANLDFSNKK